MTEDLSVEIASGNVCLVLGTPYGKLRVQMEPSTAYKFANTVLSAVHAADGYVRPMEKEEEYDNSWWEDEENWDG